MREMCYIKNVTGGTSFLTHFIKIYFIQKLLVIQLANSSAILGLVMDVNIIIKS